MPTKSIARLIAGAALASAVALPAASPSLAASHHKTHHPKKAKRMTLSTARATALKSAAPLIIDPADEVRVTGCTPVARAAFSCGLELHAAQSASVCKWSVVVAVTSTGPDAVKYSHVDCAG